MTISCSELRKEYLLFLVACQLAHKQAEIESEYVYEVLMKENEGFITLHQFVKDALMQKNGIIKVYYEDTSTEVVQDWTGLTQEQLMAIEADPLIEILQMEEVMVGEVQSQNPTLGPSQPPQVFIDVKVKITNPDGRVRGTACRRGPEGHDPRGDLPEEVLRP